MSKKYFKIAVLWTFLLLNKEILATELEPWYGPYLELESRSSLLYQKFDKFATASGHKKYDSNDLFLKQSFALSFDKYGTEVELVSACTRKQHFNLDQLKLTARYLVLNDIVDDFISLNAGFSLIQVGKPALFDPASFHHGRFEGEVHLAIGKEIGYRDSWQKRFFFINSLGLSGSYPWIRSTLSYKQNYLNIHQFEIFEESLVGFGHRRLRVDSFSGYGPIRHRSIDIGFKYSRALTCTKAVLTCEYSYRVYAKNFPKNTSRVGLKLFYPFGLGI